MLVSAGREGWLLDEGAPGQGPASLTSSHLLSPSPNNVCKHREMGETFTGK